MTSRDVLALAMLKAGYSDTHVAAVLDVSEGTIQDQRKRAGIESPTPIPQCRRPRGLVAQVAQLVNDLRWDGKRPEWIAVKLRVSRRTVYRALRPEMREGARRCISAATRERWRKNMCRVRHLGTAATAQMWVGRRVG